MHVQQQSKAAARQEKNKVWPCHWQGYVQGVSSSTSSVVVVVVYLVMVLLVGCVVMVVAAGGGRVMACSR